MDILMPINSDEGIRDLLNTTKTIALVGASPDPERASHAVMRYMISRGVPSNRLRSQGFGETQPVADNGTPEGRALDRRVVLRRTQ